MKKNRIFIYLLIIAIFLTNMTNVFAEYGLMSLKELQEQQLLILQAIWENEEWQEVEVPAGVYLIGRDIPAGDWAIHQSGRYSANVQVGDKLNEAKTEIDLFNSKDYVYEYFDQDDYPNGYSITLKEGLFLVLGRTVIFTRQIKPTLNFK